MSSRLLTPLLVALVVAAALLVGLRPGGDSQESAPPSPHDSAANRVVTAEQFCAGFDALAAARAAHLAAAGAQTTGDLRDVASTVGDLAEGIDLPADAYAGLSFVIDAFLSLPDDATAQDLVEADELATLRDSANADALLARLCETCAS